MTQRLVTALVAAILGVLILLALAGTWHLYQDHVWDDQIRTIQRQQLTAPKPAEK